MMFFIGNSFPMSLVRRPVSIVPVSIRELRHRLQTEPWISFWGHANTLAAANAITQCDLTPLQERPAVKLNQDGFPELDGIAVSKCLILTPFYANGVRPPIGREVQPSEIAGYQVLQIRWT